MQLRLPRPFRAQVIRPPWSSQTRNVRDVNCISDRVRCMSSSNKSVWVSTDSKDVVTAALESGITTLLVDDQHTPYATQQGGLTAWRQLGRFSVITCSADGQLVDEGGQEVGWLRVLRNAEDVRAAEKEAGRQGVTVVDALDWKIIPAENLVAAFQGEGCKGRLLAVAGSCEGGRVMLEALEAGTHGVVLRTDDALEVRKLASYLAQREAQHAQRLQYTAATVTRVQPVGMGDRACVDLATLLVPGQGLCVGSFARGLFLIHSECGESAYINSRPFRVNAGGVHSYVRAPGGKTAYLSELKSGAEVVVVDSEGREAVVVIGRVKIEARPLVLVEAVTPAGDTLSVLLQNAETVKLVGPRARVAGTAGQSGMLERGGRGGGGEVGTGEGPGQGEQAAAGQDASMSPSGEDALGGALQAPGLSGQEGVQPGMLPRVAERAESGARVSLQESRAPRKGGGKDGGMDQGEWQAVSVSSLREGDEVYVLLQPAARHTGMSVEEKVKEV